MRLAAMVVGLLPILIAEMLLRAWGLPHPSATADPFVDLHQLRPLFRPAKQAEFMELDPSRLNLFQPVSFRRKKPSGCFRVFALGGSTTYGEPYQAATAFPKWTELSLQAAAPEQEIEVINCGGLSYASYRVLAILREVLQYEPDLIVVYTGQNEYLERRTYEDTAESPLFGRLSHLRIVQCVQQLLGNSVAAPRDQFKNRTAMQAEVDALLDYSGGLQEYHRYAAWREPVIEHFRWNIEQMCQLCRVADVGLLLVNPVTNLLDCPPIKFESDAKLSPAELARFEELWDEGRTTPQPQTAKELLEQAHRLDPRHAGVNYALGRLAYARGEDVLAKEYLVQAKDTDVCPLRATSQLQQTLLNCAVENGVALVDADRLFSDLSDRGIVGQRWLVDHIHPSVEGHQRLGQAIAERTIDSDLFPAAIDRDAWRAEQQRLFQQHLDSLGEEYYQRGKQRLRGLLLWTQGRAKKVRPEAENIRPQGNELQ